ncbi:MAG: putative molybdenum carrier protein [Planctomycetaceae bacterium]
MAKQQTPRRRKPVAVSRVISGGQTGVDRAALDAAIAAEIDIGGWCPRGRRAEDGRVPVEYPLLETAARSYAVRTEWNVRDADGTLVVVLDDISSGTRLTIDVARKLEKPLLVIHLLPPTQRTLLSETISGCDHIPSVVDWVRRNRIRVLNVAGPRASSDANVYPQALEFLQQLFAELSRTYAASKKHG